VSGLEFFGQTVEFRVQSVSWREAAISMSLDFEISQSAEHPELLRRRALLDKRFSFSHLWSEIESAIAHATSAAGAFFSAAPKVIASVVENAPQEISKAESAIAGVIATVTSDIAAVVTKVPAPQKEDTSFHISNVSTVLLW
jgi:hypothetical protein